VPSVAQRAKDGLSFKLYAKHGLLWIKLSYKVLVTSNGKLTTIMHYAYILRSIRFPNQTYIGSTSNLQNRIVSHNNGANKHTTKFKPWKTVWVCGFLTKQKAMAFEQYLKTASGIAFRRKRLI